MMIWIGLGIFVVAGLGVALFLKIIQYTRQQIL